MVFPKSARLLCCVFVLSVWKASSALCGSATLDKGVHGLYEDGVRYFWKGNYSKAIKVFDEIEALYPFSQVAVNSSLVSAVAHYEVGQYVEAASLADSYIGAYPVSKVVDFAYYLRVSAKYMQIQDMELDQKIAQEVMELAAEFVRMFPKSRYIKEMSNRLLEVRQHMSGKELLVARFYLSRGEYIAAIKRLLFIVDKYPDTSYLQESFYRLAEAYAALGDEQSAMSYLKRLTKGSVWYSRKMHLVSGLSDYKEQTATAVKSKNK